MRHLLFAIDSPDLEAETKQGCERAELSAIPFSGACFGATRTPNPSCIKQVNTYLVDGLKIRTQSAVHAKHPSVDDRA